MSNFVALIVEMIRSRESLADLRKAGLEVVSANAGVAELCWLQPVLTSGSVTDVELWRCPAYNLRSMPSANSLI